jgi:tetratricopeptide (TPR) repeat protein
MIQRLLVTFVFGVVIFGSAATAIGQRDNDVLTVRRGTINLFGDFKIENADASTIKPQSLQLLLYTTGGTLVSRQQISNNTRYRFLNLPTGEYNLVVELDNTEITRLYIQLLPTDLSDVRKDIVLQWRENLANASRKGSSSYADSYPRSSANNSLFNRAEQEITKKNYTAAVSMLKEILSNDPKDFEVWNALATVYSLQKDQSEAEKAYLRALGEKPSFLIALLNLGKHRFAQKNYEGAIEILSEAIKLHPESATAHLILGEAYLQIKKGSKAVVHLNEALRIDPIGSADAHLRLAALYNAAGLKDRAVAEYEQLLTKLPNHPDKKKIEEYIKENRRQE